VRDPSAAELLDVWETGYAASTEAAAVTLLDLAWPDLDEPAIDLPIGERDWRLFDLRERLFGSRLTSAVTCSSCGETLEMAMDAADIRRAADARPAALLVADVGDRVITIRLPTTRDLVAIRDAPDPAEARRRLAVRCIVAHPGRDAPPSPTDEVVDAIEAALATADPRADIELDATCPSCGSSSRSVFDIAAFLRAELDAWARRTLHEVAVLATSFGWHEHDILAMSAWRRRYYLEAAAS
jgi:hypothetical protein